MGENLKEVTGKSKGKEKKDKIAIRVSQTQPVTGTTQWISTDVLVAYMMVGRQQREIKPVLIVYGG